MSDSAPLDGSFATVLARRLVARAGVGRTGAQDAARAGEQLLGHLCHNLTRWVGSDGCHALLTRALAGTRPQHRLLEQVRHHAKSADCLTGFAAAAETHPPGDIDDAVVALVAAIAELLGRLVGEEIATQLVDQDAAGVPTPAAVQEESDPSTTTTARGDVP
ncbi:MAG: hypothetical protein H0X64_01060 [Gemmatimonadaceae bacterium]|nr:hypothetical protein [Gemmatimonadaceae bacterium]